MNDAKGKCTCPSDLPYCVCGAKSLGKIITRKPIVATEEELEQNSRSKSAKLRIFERVYQKKIQKEEKRGEKNLWHKLDTNMVQAQEKQIQIMKEKVKKLRKMKNKNS